MRSDHHLVLFSVLLALSGDAWAAENNHHPGVTGKEIRIGNTSAYSGLASAYSIVAKTEAAYFKKASAEGGINGRKIVFIGSRYQAQHPLNWKRATSTKNGTMDF